MSRGLGKVESAIVDFMTDYDDHHEQQHVSMDGESGIWMLFQSVTMPRCEWHRECRHREPTQSQRRSLYRAIQSLERKGYVTVRWESANDPFRGRGRSDCKVIKGDGKMLGLCWLSDKPVSVHLNANIPSSEHLTNTQSETAKLEA